MIEFYSTSGHWNSYFHEWRSHEWKYGFLWPRVFVSSLVLVLYGPFCHGALKHDISTLFTTFFVWTSLQFILIIVRNTTTCSLLFSGLCICPDLVKITKISSTLIDYIMLYRSMAIIVIGVFSVYQSNIDVHKWYKIRHKWY